MVLAGIRSARVCKQNTEVSSALLRNAHTAIVRSGHVEVVVLLRSIDNNRESLSKASLASRLFLSKRHGIG